MNASERRPVRRAAFLLHENVITDPVERYYFGLENKKDCNVTTTRWIGAYDAKYADQGNWAGGRMPRRGDVAMLQTGRPTLEQNLNGFTIYAGRADGLSGFEVDGRTVVLGPSLRFHVAATGRGDFWESRTAQIFVVSGTLHNQGLLDVWGTNGIFALNIPLRYSLFINSGTVAAYGSAAKVDISGPSQYGIGGQFQNDGCVWAIGGHVEIGVPTTGNGSYTVSKGGKLTFDHSVGGGKIHLINGTLEFGHAVVDASIGFQRNPGMTFLATVDRITTNSVFSVRDVWDDYEIGKVLLDHAGANDELELWLDNIQIANIPLAGRFDERQFRLEPGGDAAGGYDMVVRYDPIPLERV